MPLTLAVIKGAPGNSITLSTVRCVLGRDPTCDLVLDDAAAEGRHATVRSWEEEWVIIAESTNRTSVSGVPLRKGVPRVVRPGDLILIGQTELELREDATSTLNEPKATRELALQAVRAALRGHGHPEVPTVRIAEGANIRATLALVEDGKVYAIGRAKTCDLCLSDVAASRTHVQVRRVGGRVFLRDTSLSKGALLGSTPLLQEAEVEWTPERMAVLGETVLALDVALESVIEQFLEKQPLAIVEPPAATPESDLPFDPPTARTAPTEKTGAPNRPELSGARSPSPMVGIIHATNPKKRPTGSKREAVFQAGIVAISLALCVSIAWLLFFSGR
jgi:pSer/pThr/pTyr-binding forkhead associated (FHA) protein